MCFTAGDTTENGAVVTISTGGDTSRQAENDLAHQAGVAAAEVLPRDGNIDFGCVTLYVAVSGRVKEAVLENGFKK